MYIFELLQYLSGQFVRLFARALARLNIKVRRFSVFSDDKVRFGLMGMALIIGLNVASLVLRKTSVPTPL